MWLPAVTGTSFFIQLSLPSLQPQYDQPSTKFLRLSINARPKTSTLRCAPASVVHPRARQHAWGSRRTTAAAKAKVSLPDDMATVALPPTIDSSSKLRESATPANKFSLADGIMRTELEFSARALRRHFGDSPAWKELEHRLQGSGVGGHAGCEKIEAQFRELLGTVLLVVGSDQACARAMLVECPALLLWSAAELLARLEELKSQEGVSDEQALRLAIDFPSLLTLPTAARKRAGFFIGEVGLTVKEVGRLAKCRPDVLGYGEEGHLRSLVDYLLNDMGIGKVAFRRMVRRQPGLLSLRLTDEIVEKVDFFVEEMGLGVDQVAKIFSSHPQILYLSLKNSIRPTVKWLGTAYPAIAANQAATLHATGEASAVVPTAISTATATATTMAIPKSILTEKMPSALADKIAPTTSTTITTTTDTTATMDAERATAGASILAASVSISSVSDPSVSDTRGEGRKNTSYVPYALENKEVNRGVKDDEEEDKGDGKKEIKNENEEPAATVYTGTIDMPDIVNGEWEWGLGLDAEGRRSVVAKQGDILWKSVPGNLAKTAAWFVCEVGLSWDEIGKLATQSPALLCLSVENNLQPTVGFLVNELGMDPARIKQTIINQPSLLTLSVTSNMRPKAAFFRDELGAHESEIAELLNQCPRVMNASVEGRIIPRVKAMRAAGMPATFAHLRTICNYTEERFATWFDRQKTHLEMTTASLAAAAAVAPTKTKTKTKATATTGAATAATMLVKTVAIDAPHVGGGSREAAAVAPSVIPAPKALRGRRLSGADSNGGRPSVRADSLAELGITYTVSAARPRVGAATGSMRSVAAGVEVGARSGVGEEEAFAPGRAEAKRLVGQVSRGLEVLDLYCGTGGFALNAASGMARSALGVDRELRAVRASTKNAAANGLDRSTLFVRRDALSFAKKAASKGKVWDLVIFDPPSSSRSRSSASSAARAVSAYARVAENVSRLVRSGGMLMAVESGGRFATLEELTDACSAAARTAGVSLTLLDASGRRQGSGGGVYATSLPTSDESDSDVFTSSSKGGGEGRGGVGGMVGADGASGEPLWALFVCSKFPAGVVGVVDVGDGHRHGDGEGDSSR